MADDERGLGWAEAVRPWSQIHGTGWSKSPNAAWLRWKDKRCSASRGVTVTADESPWCAIGKALLTYRKKPLSQRCSWKWGNICYLLVVLPPFTITREKERAVDIKDSHILYPPLCTFLFFFPGSTFFDLPRACMTNGCDKVSRAFCIQLFLRLQTTREMDEEVLPALSFGQERGENK